MDEIVQMIVGVDYERIVVVRANIYEDRLVEQPFEHVFVRIVEGIADEEVFLDETISDDQGDAVFVDVCKIFEHSNKK